MEAIKEALRGIMTTCQKSDLSCKGTKKMWYDVMNELEGNLPDYDCTKCRNKGVIYFEKDGYEYSRECECMKIRRSVQRINKSGMKDILSKYTFDTYNAEEQWQKSVKHKAEQFVNSGERCLFIGGQVGCGKTHLCTAAVGELINSGKEARYMKWRDDVVKIKQKANTDDYNKLVEPFKNVTVLYIDDLFKVQKGEKPTPADVNIAFEILNHRYLNDGLITIISSERTGRELIEIDEAVGSRIVEMSGNYFISIGHDTKKNYRLRGIL